MKIKILSTLIFYFLIISCSQKVTESEKIESTTLLKTTKSWNGNTIPQIDGQPEITVSKVIIPVGMELPKHIHPVITTGYLMKGELTIKEESGKQFILKAGEPLVEVSNTIHFGKSTGNEDAEIMVFYIGKEGSQVTTMHEH